MSIDTTNAKTIKLSEKLSGAFYRYAQAKNDEAEAKATIKLFDKPLKEFLNKQVDNKKIDLSQVYKCGSIVFRYKDNGKSIQTNYDKLEKFLNKHGKKLSDFKDDKGSKAPTLEVEILITSK